MEEMAQSVPGLKKQWITAEDERVRGPHKEAHLQIRDIGELFEVGGESLMMPRDPAGSPENVINCRCQSVPYIEETPSLETIEKGYDEETLKLTQEKKELGIAYDENGNEILRRFAEDRTPNFIRFTNEEVAKFRNVGYLTHNHPGVKNGISGASLSKADITTSIIQNLKGIRAIGNNKTLGPVKFILNRPEKGWPLISEAKRVYSSSKSAITKKMNLEMFN
jgi:hypothetical protein